MGLTKKFLTKFPQQQQQHPSSSSNISFSSSNTSKAAAATAMFGTWQHKRHETSLKR